MNKLFPPCPCEMDGVRIYTEYGKPELIKKKIFMYILKLH